MKAQRQDGEDSRRLRILEEEMKQLREDFLRLHKTVGQLLEEISHSSPTEAIPAGDISLAPAGPSPPLLQRALGRLRRKAARCIRGIIAIIHPCQERIGALEFRAAEARSNLARPEDLRCLGPQLEPALLEDLCWLLALESVDGIRFGDSFVQRPGSGADLPMPPGPALLEAAEKLKRALVIRDLGVEPERSIAPLMLHPEGLGDVPALFGGGAYGVALPASTRMATLLLGLEGVNFPHQRRSYPWALLLGRELVCGLETRVYSALRALGPGLIISLVETSDLGRKRLRDLELMGSESHDFGSVLHAAGRPGAFVSALRGSGASTLWAIGGEELDAALDLLRQEHPEIRIVREDPGGTGNSAGERLSIPVGSVGDEGAVIPTPSMGLPERSHGGETDGDGNGTAPAPGRDVRTVLMVDDLVGEARPEDAILLAAEARGPEAFQYLWVGEGPLAARIDELRRLFGLANFHRLAPRELSVALDRANLLCVLGESPYLPPAATAAAAAALPVLSVRGNELEHLADSASVSFAGGPGDLEAMARALLGFPHKEERVSALQLPKIEDFTEKIRKLLRG